MLRVIVVFLVAVSISSCASRPRVTVDALMKDGAYKLTTNADSSFSVQESLHVGQNTLHPDSNGKVSFKNITIWNTYGFADSSSYWAEDQKIYGNSTVKGITKALALGTWEVKDGLICTKYDTKRWHDTCSETYYNPKDKALYVVLENGWAPARITKIVQGDPTNLKELVMKDRQG
ncbi:hypothetical protein GCM10011332_32620 [Terasakiella brassicae]|uniref:Uncharacterized protein n=1 Tax=Terasakiella brassicae TaxID=1634917 RepID=A0A917C7I8_9PROT|nr:hypothetical protein [Terasakiella brassicae]GGF76113.1 hypothetical protein GCM10011332_32620 [Terasakiella brassicae]